ncbi:MAG: hypothetical protein E4H33_00035 [Anaerolineales bacterium]|nr:MAG: hypothetical protein E4H33_00035 [Anaerolineales bacterium]
MNNRALNQGGYFCLLGLIFLILILGTSCQFRKAYPEARHGAKMIFDPVGNKILLFGGRGENLTGGKLLNDIWVFDSETQDWQEIKTSSPPTSRLSPGFVYDPSHHQVILFGGYTNKGRLADTWLLDLDEYQWKEIHPPHSPPARSDMGMAYDKSNQVVVLFGGYCLENQRDYCDDTWVFDPDLNHWIEMNPISSPPVMYGHSLNYGSFKQQILLWGGHMSIMDQGRISSAGYNNSLWSYSYPNNQWIELSPVNQNKPSPRYWHQAAYDSEIPGLVIFGGDGGYGFLADTWLYNPVLNSWEKIKFLQPPPARTVGSLVYSPDDEQIFLFGGLNEDMESFRDTWSFTFNEGGNWTMISGN